MMPFLGLPASAGIYTGPAPPPLGGLKPTDAPVLRAKGLSLIWQDRLGEVDAPTDDRQFFQATTGNRVQEDPVVSSSYSFPSENNRRLSFVTFEGKPCLKVSYFAGQHGWMNYRNQYLPQGYREFGLCVDIKYPAGFDLRGPSNGNIYGKTAFGLAVGHSDYGKPGVPSSPRGWTGEVTEVKDVWGGALGINFKYWPTAPSVVRYGWYPHVVGAYVNGADVLRQDKFSDLWRLPGYGNDEQQDIPIGPWHRLELYGRVDTNRRDGVLEIWLNGVLLKQLPNLDLGGWVGNRGITSGAGQLVGSSGGGWRFRGIFIREMIGGSTSLASLVPQYGGVYYAYNWRVYGRV